MVVGFTNTHAIRPFTTNVPILDFDNMLSEIRPISITKCLSLNMDYFDVIAIKDFNVFPC
jgi:hypothetical protein